MGPKQLQSKHLLATLCFFLPSSSVASDTPPAWSTTYSVQGLLSIPFAEISEPIAAWADLGAGASRVDYYGGMVKTFQRGDLGEYGLMAKIIPVTTETQLNKIDCFKVDGGEDMRIQPQSVLPDISEFSLLGDDLKNGESCQKWQKIEKIGEKINKYTMWLKVSEGANGFAVPVHYEMKGYNNVFGSHFDHYYLEYSNFSPEVPDPSVFNLFSSMTCTGWPGPGMDHTYTMNPVREFVDNHDVHVSEQWGDFTKKHAKEYTSKTEEGHRLDIFRQNLRFIHSKNRQGLTYTLASNHLADWSASELAALRGRTFDSKLSTNGGRPQEYSNSHVKDAPEELDWRMYGAVTPVKDQSVCGSCWSFGSVGSLEGTLFLQTGVLTRLSQQALVDCSWGFGNNGCDGGEDFRAYQWMMAHGGIPTEDSYGPYLGQDSYCHVNQSTMGLKIKGWVNVTSGDIEALRVAIAWKGPVSVAIDASHRSLSFYSNGVYYEPECSSSMDGLDHAVLAVGYGEILGEKYWLIKNSWSTHWGNDGYVLMAQKENNCGVATAATYVIPDLKTP